MTHRGFLGVDMFFVLSGFLIVTLLLRERDRTGQISLRNFYIRRSLRIFPLYYLLILLVGVAAFVLDKGALRWAPYAESIPFLLTYTYNWVSYMDASLLYVSWSLATEEQFYLVWPFVIALLSETNARIALGIGLLLNLVIVFGLGNQLQIAWGLQEVPLVILQITFFPILLGVLLAYVLHEPLGFRWASKWFGGTYSSLVLAGALFVTLNLPHDDISGLHRTIIHFEMGAWLISLVVNESGVGQGILRTFVFTRTGAISYGLYLWHMVGLLIVTRVFPEPGVISAVGATIATYALAELSFRYFEMPFLQLKRRFQT